LDFDKEEEEATKICGELKKRGYGMTLKGSRRNQEKDAQARIYRIIFGAHIHARLVVGGRSGGGGDVPEQIERRWLPSLALSLHLAPRKK
jgi:hypothetical protein